MHARNQAIAGLIVSLFVLSGCAIQEGEETPSPKVTQLLEDELQVIQEPSHDATEPETIHEDDEQTVEPTQAPTEIKIEESEPAEEVVEAEEQVEAEEPSGPTLAQIAYSQLSQNADGSAEADSSVVVMSPDLPDFNKLGLVEVTSAAMSFFDDDYGIPSGYRIIAFTDRELDWADQKLAEYRGMLPPGFSSWESWVASNQYMKPDECWMSVNSFGATHFCMAIKESVARQQVNTIAHEYVHNIQINSLGIDTTKTPSWITEGGAEYLGFVIVQKGSSHALNYLANWQTQYLAETYGGMGWKDYIFRMTEDEFVSAMDAIALSSVDPLADQGNKRFGMYTLGAVANEYLIGKYSYDTYISYIMDIGKGGQNWSTSFQKFFGLTPSQFYIELYDYLKEVYS